ncbi:T9SS sorting signal type C domain-containing protein [Flavobacterium psychroterrae]|uniref:T9SS sorting signal type C domain-containing protein n=1 Tax=Flavobacterium psychroterrae TaxID=2133767 RepID=A0ABS5PBS6_9FLAO|nr:T9SS sorting signal type C domain-containing protein [Flavobacterium psychroterrae]MBS7231310.1 T9SS sorting signal type C domain-containing protein [Flavobacterium psychroterrae]
MRLKLSLLLVFIITLSWSQTIQTFTTNGTFTVPIGVTSISVDAWGGGGSGGGASGAGLLFGRGAAGGGGGAYASNTLTVTPGTTLNVVVAGQASGTSGANGTAGGNSTITGFESLLFAAGGAGGAANNAGGTPIGGNGGTVAGSAGTIKLPGFSGVNGNTWSLLSILLTSGAGGNGANFGGAGGAAVGSLILGTAPGNSGSVPGGGGSGAINSALGTAQAGGTGGAGRVVITYTIPPCPTYTISGTTATNTCISDAQSTVTISSGALSLPVGSYVVTYNRSNPSATALTANMTVTTAGTGTFTAVGLTSAGSSTITITKLDSGSCSSNISTNNTVTITVSPATVGGTVSGGTSICSGNTSSLLTLSGHTGSVVKWQSSISPFTTWTDIANTTTTYTSGSLTQTTQFRAVVKSGLCDPANSAATTVTVGPAPTITVDATAQSVCISPSAQNTTLSYSGTTGSPITYSIVWSSSPENSFEAINDAALSGSNITILVPAETAVGTYTGSLTVKNADGCVSSGILFTVTVNDIPSIGTFGVMYSVCTSTSSQTGSLEYSFSSGNPTSYAINWDSAANAALLADQPDTPFAFQESGNIDTIVIPANVPGGIYQGTLTLSNGGCLESRSIKLTVSPTTVGGAVTGGTTVCSGNTSGELTLSRYTGFIINWQSSVSPFTTWTDIDNTEPTYTSDALTETTQFRAVIQSGECNEENSEATTVTLNPPPTIVLPDPVVNFCTDIYEQHTSLNYDGAIGNPVTYSIVWNSSPANDFPAVTDQALPSGYLDISVPAGAPAGNYGGTVTVKNADGCISSPITFGANIVAPPTITTNGTIAPLCTSSSSQNATLVYSATTGSPTSYSIVWGEEANDLLLVDQSDTLFSFSPSGGIINTIVIPANVPAGTYSGSISIGLGDCFETQVISITILPATVGGTVTGGTTITSGSTSGLLTLSGHTGSVIKWQSSVSPFTTWTDIVNTNTTYTSGPLTETTQFRAVVKSGVCDAVNSEPTTVTVGDLPTITTSDSAADICTNANDDFTRLFYSETTGSPVTYSIVWNSSPANSFVPVIDEVLTEEYVKIFIPETAIAGVYTGTITVKNASGISSLGTTFTVNILASPTVTTTGIIDPVFTSANLQNSTLAYSGITGSPQGYSIIWDSAANAALLVNQRYTSFAFSSAGGVINTIDIPANVPAGTYSGIMYYVEDFCFGFNPVSITIIPSSSAKIASTDTEILKSLKNPITVSALNKVINVETPNQIIDKVYIFDVSGTLLYEKGNVSDSKLTIDNLRSSNQVLVVKVVLNNNQSETRKVIF